MQKVPLRDPFLAEGLLLAIFDHQFDEEMNVFLTNRNEDGLLF